MRIKFGATAMVFSIFMVLLPMATASAASEFDNMVLIPAGEFRAGADPRVATEECNKYYKKGCQSFWFRHESPAHAVFLDAFYIDKHEATQLDFKRVMGREAPMFTGGNLPVIMVSWNDANEYCARVGKRLPTEMEWEKAAKGGRDTLYPWGDGAESGKANFCDRKCPYSHNVEQFDDGFAELAPVGSFPANGYGLFDMAGNVSEWVADWHREDYYKESPRNNPKGPADAMDKVYRGGGYGSTPDSLRSAYRNNQPPKERMSDVGFRCAATPGPAAKTASSSAPVPASSPQSPSAPECSAAALPQEIVIQLSKPAKISKIEINPSPSDINKSRWIRQVGLYYGNSPDGPWNGLARRELEQKDEFQSFVFAFPFEASYVLVRVESNWGGNYTHMSEIRIVGEDGSNR